MISVIILTKNEEDRLQACIESVAGLADEVVVVDSGSQDKTVELAKKLGAKVFTRSFDNYVNQKNWAFEKTKGDWVFYLDADERVLADLKQEINGSIQSTKFSAYAISRRNIIFGQEVRYGPFWPDWIIRLVKRSDFQGWQGEVHETLKFRGELGYSKCSLLHLTHRNVDQVISKNLHWSQIDAKLRLQAHHPKMSSLRFLRILTTELFYQGITRRGFFSGTVGTIDALLQTFSLLTTYIRLWEMQQPVPLEQKYSEIDKNLIKNNFKY
ncbi:glycosyltransferase family 2 protein [Patescibacteria group bacterium]|nr:glycosyltransferase family 2 protein [Patescibacteria group bacterium]